ncbi:MAG: hypothetical protein ACR2QO_06385, partial [Acidimicrobiales bacterium]
LAWLRIVLGEDGESTTNEFLARPSLDELHLLVPTTPPAAAAASLRRFDDDRGFVRIAAGMAGRMVARLGLLGLVPGQRIRLPRFALVEELANILGEPELVASVTVGTRRRNRKPVLQLLTLSGRIVGYAKVGWSPLSQTLVANEGATLRLVEGQLPRWLDVPAVIHHGPWRGGEVVVTSPLAPPPQFASVVVGWLPAGRDHYEPDTFDALVETIASTDARGQQHVGELSLFDEWQRIGLTVAFGEAFDKIRERHADVVVRAGLWHGDLTPWNLSARRSTITVWDWEFAGRGRPIGFDALHHEFERHRRANGGSNRSAIAATIAAAARILGPHLDPVSKSRPAIEAIVDLYLCELLAREVQLDGQRWQGGSVAELADVAGAALAERRAGWR